MVSRPVTKKHSPAVFRKGFTASICMNNLDCRGVVFTSLANMKKDKVPSFNFQHGVYYVARSHHDVEI